MIEGEYPLSPSAEAGADSVVPPPPGESQFHQSVAGTGESAIGNGSAEVVGAAVPTDEEQARLAALNNDPEHPRGNIELAEAMGDSMRTLEQMINNISGSKLPNKEARIKDLRVRGEQLAEEAKARFLEEKKIYDTVRDYAIGELIYAVGNEAVFASDNGVYRAIIELTPSSKGGWVQSGYDDSKHLTDYQAEKLVKEIFTVAGADTDSLFNADFDWASIPVDKNRFRGVYHDTNLGNGIKIAELRSINDDGKPERIRFSVVSGPNAIPEYPEPIQPKS